VIDTKKPVSGPLNMLRSLGSRTVLLDNVTEARMHADIVIYPSAVFENSLDWSGFRGKIYFGASYVPIADSFIKAKTERKEPTDTLRKSILVTMGGSDPNRLTYRVVSALLGSKESMKINVVLGPAFPHDERLDAIERQGYDNIKFIRNCSDLSGIMAESHIAITALGTTLYELAYMGVPAIIISNYREDESDMRAFRKLGTALSLGYHEDVSADAIRTATEGIIADGNIREKMSRYAVIDGQGADRIVSIIEELFVKRPDGYKHLMNQEYKDE
jgi:spore coat polysaccharide biosynthesis predicted glycosyltransferase SpsG